MGSRGLALSGCLPLWGREGVTLAISTPVKKFEGISTELKSPFSGSLTSGPDIQSDI